MEVHEVKLGTRESAEARVLEQGRYEESGVIAFSPSPQPMGLLRLPRRMLRGYCVGPAAPDVCRMFGWGYCVCPTARNLGLLRLPRRFWIPEWGYCVGPAAGATNDATPTGFFALAPPRTHSSGSLRFPHRVEPLKLARRTTRPPNVRYKVALSQCGT